MMEQAEFTYVGELKKYVKIGMPSLNTSILLTGKP